jgi:hypothetical protein
VHLLINVNGPALVGRDYPGAWTADRGPGGVCGPSHFENPSSIHGTVDGALFHGEMFGNPLRCVVGGLPPATYDVGLYFAEIFFGPGCPGGGVGIGSRVFDIYIENTRVLSGFDIFKEGGCAASTSNSTGHPVVKHFTMPITDGTLDLSMPASVNNGNITAIELRSLP